MRYSLRALWLTLVLLIFSSVCAYGQSCSIPEINIQNINIPDGYMVCQRESCTSEFQSVLNSMGYSYNKWKTEVMIPEDIYLYAIKEDGGVLCVKSEPFSEITFSMYNPDDTDGYNEITKLSYDYKLISDSISRENAVKKYRYNITTAGIDDAQIRRISWIDNGLKECIPYILCSYKDKDLYIADYHTVYNGNKLSVTITESTPISSQELFGFSDMVSAMEYTYYPDYTEAKIILKEKQEKDMAEKMEVYSTAKLVQYVFGFFITLMIMFAIYLDSRKIMIKRQYEFY